jgi:translation initiation factor 2B subunit (eIF-2B alpha/beta/delta family)
MFKLMGNKVPNMDLGEGSMNIGPIIKNLNSMYLLDCDDPEISKEIKSDVSKYIKKYDFEMLMEIKEKGETVQIFTTGNEKTVTQFILTAAEYEAFTFICLDGTMSRADLEKAIAKATQKME